MTDLKVLIVEDEPDNAAVAEILLNGADIKTIHVDSAEQAFNLLVKEAEKFSGVLIDLALPGMDGYALMKAIRATPALAQIPLIATTAFHTPELRADALNAGFDGYCQKPLNPTEFLNTLQRLLSER